MYIDYPRVQERMKNGASKNDQAKIQKLHAAGNSASEISQTLLIRLATVEKFLPVTKKPRKNAKAKPVKDEV